MVFKSSSPAGPFYPRGCANPTCGGSIDAAEMLASLVTDTNAANACDEDFMWGLGDVTPFSGQYIATYDLSKQRSDSTKFHLLFSAADGADRTSVMYPFAEISTSQSPRKIIYEPVPFAVDSNTVGVIFRFADTNQTNIGTGYLYIDFTSFPTSYTVKVLASDNTYRTLSSNHLIDFQFKNIGSTGSVNRVLTSGSDWIAYSSYGKNGQANPETCPASQTKGSRMASRPFHVLADGRWSQWLAAASDVLLTNNAPKEWDYSTGVMFPSPLVDSGGKIRFYFTQDSQCQGGFAYLDQVYSEVNPASDPCVQNGQNLCLQNNRFKVTLTSGGTPGKAFWYSPEGGWFWLFGSQNPEVVVKILDGRPVNGKFWVYHGSLTTQPYTITVTDTSNGAVKTYTNSAGNPSCGGADLGAFSLTDSGGSTAEVFETADGGTALALCSPSATALCLLDKRFKVEVKKDGVKQPTIPLSDLGGMFWFFSPCNPEVPVKVIDGTPVNGKFWAFYGSLTNQSYQVIVTDMSTSVTRTYNSGAAYCGASDTSAF